MLKKLTNTLLSPLQEIINDSRSLGVILVLCTVISLFLANSNWSGLYLSAWEYEFHTPQQVHLPHTALHWINDGLMAVFFFLVGMEIKRELLDGELKDPKKAMLPIFAAVGGMVVPAFIYSMINKGTPYADGWGIPMATDIAFSLGIASILGSRVPASLKIFLTALAIIDDLGAIVMIAVFYGDAVDWVQLAMATGIVLIIAFLAKHRVRFFFRMIFGLLLWYFIFNSGVHATVAGVIFAFTIPMDELDDIEHKLIVPVNFFILPIFALANTAIVLQGNFIESLNNTLNYGIAAGLVIGKPLGIMIFSWMLVRLKWGSLPENVTWKQLLGIGMLAGIGFTMSIFIATLAFTDPAATDIAKVSVLIASLLSVILGAGMLIVFSKRLTAEP